MKVRKTSKIVAMSLFLSCSFSYADYSHYDTNNNVFLGNELLPQSSEWEGMYNDASEIERSLNSGDGEYTLVYKSKGGSSQQTLVQRTSDGKVMGIWSAPNHATYLEGEIFAFNLSRLLGHSEWSTPGTRMYLTGPGREAAYKAINPNKTPRARQCNRDHMNSYYQANNHFMPGAYFGFMEGVKPADLPELVYRKRGVGMTPHHWAVKFVTGADNTPLPTDAPAYYRVKGGKKANRLLKERPDGDYRESTQRSVAKQISFMSIVDALNSQRDRFGIYGSNMEVMISTEGTGSSFSVSLVDNGGIATSAMTSSLKAFLGKYNSPKRQSDGSMGEAIPAIRRFDREVFDRVQEINDFIQTGGEGSLSIDGIEYNSIEDLKYALGIEEIAGSNGAKPDSVCGGKSNHFYLFNLDKQWKTRWSNFKKALSLVAGHMKRMYEQNPEDTFL